MAETDPPLYAIDGYGPPGDFVAEWLSASDGLRLRTAFFPAAEPRGSVVLNTGRTEFIEKYYEVIGELLGRGFSVLTHDWRGQGLSDRLLPDRLKGHANGAEPFLDDFGRLLARHEAQLPRPWILVGHSMGGALSLLHLLGGTAAFQGCVLSSPMTGVNLKGNWEPLVDVSLAGRWVLGEFEDYIDPSTAKPWEDQFAGNSVTHDAARFARTVNLLRAHHDLALGGPTWGWLDFALHAAHAIQTDPAAATLGIPLRVVAAGQESLADTPATQRFCGRVPGAECVVAPDARHEILMELDPTRALFWAQFDAMSAQLTPS